MELKPPCFLLDSCIYKVYTFPMTTKVQKWGNSLAMRLPKELAKNFNLKAGMSVIFIDKVYGFEVRAEVKKKKPKYTLKELLKGITPENVHPETDWGKPMGKEIW
jgi:antitoxin MazE